MHIVYGESSSSQSTHHCICPARCHTLGQQGAHTDTTPAQPQEGIQWLNTEAVELQCAGEEHCAVWQSDKATHAWMRVCSCSIAPNPPPTPPRTWCVVFVGHVDVAHGHIGVTELGAIIRHTSTVPAAAAAAAAETRDSKHGRITCQGGWSDTPWYNQHATMCKSVSLYNLCIGPMPTLTFRPSQREGDHITAAAAAAPVLALKV
jgi:hypothetical protein